MREPRPPRRRKASKLPSATYAWDGGLLDRLIVESDLTDREVADYVGVSEKTIYNWKTNRSEPPGRHVPHLEDLFGQPRGVFFPEVPLSRSNSTAPRSGATVKREE